MNINKDKLLDKLIKVFVREKELVDKRTIRYLAHRYARYISGSNCAVCWHYSPCMCSDRDGGPVMYTEAEKVAYTYLNYDKFMESA